MTLSVRLTEEQSNLVEVLRTEKKLSSYISLLMSALLQDRVSTTQFLLGLSDQSVAYNDLQEATIRANLYEKWLSLKLDIPFEDWVSTLRSAEINHFSGLDMPSVDVKSTLLALLDELGLEYVEKGSNTSSEDSVSKVADMVSVGASINTTNPSDLKEFVATIVQEILATKSSSEGKIVEPISPTEPMVVVENLGDNVALSQEQNQPTVSEVKGEPSNSSSEVEPTVVGSDSTAKIDPIIDTDALISGFGLG